MSVGIVLAAFMAGLALGSYLLGKLSDKSRNPLRLYAIYEIGIGVTALASSVLLMQLAPFLVWIHTAFGDSLIVASAYPFLVAFLILIVPTILMGATLPILSRVVIRRLEKVGRELGKLYAINTLGAIVGAISAGFIFIRLFGIQGTIYLAVAGNISVGLFALAASKHYRLAEVEGIEPGKELPTLGVDTDHIPSRSVAILLLVVFALSGLTSFAYEIFWTRSLVFILGNTTYAFTLMLTAFLTGIALGSYVVRFIGDRFRHRLKLFAMIEILIGLFSATSLPTLFFVLESETIQSFIYDSSYQLGLMILSESAVALLLMLVPATLIGATLPLMGQVFVQDLHCTGTTVGKVYAVNTLGNVLGALLPGLLILPLMGIQKGILLMSALNICLGLTVFIAHWKKTVKLAAVPIGVFLVLAIGIFKMPISFQFPSEDQTLNDPVLFYEEGELVTTKVWAAATFGNKHMSVDGVNIGGTASSDFKQQVLAHLPKLLLKSFSSELSVGLGSGILIGESVKHDQLKRLVCVEISPSVARGAEFFAKENHNILNDPRAEIVIDDISHFLHRSTETFDIISADGKSAVRYASNSFSYSTEYYELLKQRLNPEGLLIQWIPDLPLSQYNLVLRTFLNAFPHVGLWFFPTNGRYLFANTFLVGSKARLDIDPQWIDHAMVSDTASFQNLGKYGLKTVDDILSHFVGSEQTLRQAIPPGPINSFDRPYYEFYSPADYDISLQQGTLAINQLIMSMRGADFEKNVLSRLEGPKRSDLWRAYEAEGVFLKAHEANLKGEPYATVTKYLYQAIELAPQSEFLLNQVANYFVEQSKLSWARQDHKTALYLARRATEIHPLSAEVHEDYGKLLFMENRTESAIFELQRALELNPGLTYPRLTLGLIYKSKGEINKAMTLWREVLLINPNDISPLVYIGVSLAQQGSALAGEKYLQRAYDLAPESPAVINGYAQVKYLAGDLSSAREIVKKGGRYYEGNPSFEGVRAKIIGKTL